MSSPTPPSDPRVHQEAPASWTAALAAAAWPAACAVAFTTYAFLPDRFPPQTGLVLYLLVAAEIPALGIAAVYAAALAQPTVAARLRLFFVCIGTGIVVVLLQLGFRMDFAVVAPALAWVLVPPAIDLCAVPGDRSRAALQARAVLTDRLHLVTLLPVLALYVVLLAIATMIVLAVTSSLTGNDYVGRFTDLLDTLDPSQFALIDSIYMGIVALSSAHVHRPAFLRSGTRLLDRPWIHRLALRKE